MSEYVVGQASEPAVVEGAATVKRPWEVPTVEVVSMREAETVNSATADNEISS